LSSIIFLYVNCAIYRSRDRYIEKCQQLEKENDEQRDRLNETIKNEKALTLALRKSTKDYKDVLKQLEAVEIEV